MIRKPFRCPRLNVKGFEFAALYTLQHGLSGNTEPQSCFEHRQILWRRLFDEARPQLVGHADVPRSTWRELLADDYPGDEPAVQCGRHHAEDLGGVLDGDEFAIGALSRRLTARDVAIAAQVADVSGAEALAAGRASALAIENAGDDGVGVMGARRRMRTRLSSSVRIRGGLE